MSPKSHIYLSLFVLSQISLVLTYDSRLRISGQDGSLISSDLERLPKSWSIIGSIDNVTYYQESQRMYHDTARENCASEGRTLARFRNKAHLDFVIANGALDQSWTDADAVFSRSMYTPNVDPIIEINESIFTYALQVNSGGGNLHQDIADTRTSPSICQSGIILDRTSHIQASRNYPKVAEIKAEMATEQLGANSPKELSFLGTYEGYHYWQESAQLTSSEARRSCESLGGGFQLATYENKSHLDFVFSQGARDYLWTGHTGILTRDGFRWGDNSLIATDIPINIMFAEFRLIARRSVLIGFPEENNNTSPSVCRFRAGR